MVPSLASPSFFPRPEKSRKCCRAWLIAADHLLRACGHHLVDPLPGPRVEACLGSVRGSSDSPCVPGKSSGFLAPLSAAVQFLWLCFLPTHPEGLCWGLVCAAMFMEYPDWCMHVHTHTRARTHAILLLVKLFTSGLLLLTDINFL